MLLTLLSNQGSKNKLWIKISGTWREAITWIKISGIWKQADPKIKIAGTWR
jgi:hypothetical protein